MRPAFLAILAFTAALLAENYAIKENLHLQNYALGQFLGKRSGDKTLSHMVRHDTLAVFPKGRDGIACATIPNLWAKK